MIGLKSENTQSLGNTNSGLHIASRRSSKEDKGVNLYWSDFGMATSIKDVGTIRNEKS